MSPKIDSVSLGIDSVSSDSVSPFGGAETVGYQVEVATGTKSRYRVGDTKSETATDQHQPTEAGAGMPQARVSATIERGVTTNRVRVKTRGDRKSGGKRVKAGRVRRDNQVRGLDYTQVCLSMPALELEAIDAWATRCQMSRSHFMRQAAKHFAEKVGLP